mmetsp:Transcript_6808/g.16594  ORF Transcript_6808/g.16594 Transcript_6808/m.16594 type:complete len:405 (+) Transcript_6808:90-1304(+)
MPPQKNNNNNNNITTLDDIRKRHQFDGAAGAGTTNAAASRSAEYAKDNNKNNSIYGSNNYCKPVGEGSGPPIPLYVIPSLAQSEICRQLLKRIHDEFVPIVRRRGFTITSISELCCCGDGLDFVSNLKCRRMNQNVWGYNQTTMFRKSTTTNSLHSIHLRLRQPNNHHRMLSYEDVAGTMAHEMSHCVHQNHGKAFYALMEEILEEHAMLQAQKLSSTPTDRNSTLPTTITTIGSGHRLGGGGTRRLLEGNKRGGQQHRAQSQRELAARAAESRKRQLQQIRRMIDRSKEPCVIEIFDDDNDVQTNVVVAIDNRIYNDVVEIITVNAARIDNDEVVEIIEPTTRKLPNRKRARESRKSGNQNQPQKSNNDVIDLTMSMNAWLCGLCTYQNRASASLCEMCHGPR